MDRKNVIFITLFGVSEWDIGFGVCHHGRSNDSMSVSFSWSKLTHDSVYAAREGTKLPVKWTAPEAIRSNIFTIKSDVWSFGILLYEIMTFGKMPYPDMSNFQVLQKVPQGYRMPRPQNCPKEMYDIMMDCWKDDEHERSTFETLQWKLEEFFDLNMTSYTDAVPNDSTVQ